MGAIDFLAGIGMWAYRIHSSLPVSLFQGMIERFEFGMPLLGLDLAGTCV